MHYDVMIGSAQRDELRTGNGRSGKRIPQPSTSFPGAFEGVPVALYTCAPNEELPITFASSDLEEHFGLDPSRLVGRSGTWIDRAHPDDRSRICHPLKGLLETGCFSAGFRLRLARSDYRWVQNELRLMRDADGRPREVIGYLLDVTRCNETKAGLERSSRSLRELAGHLQSVREAERSAIARAIHDELGQALAALKIDFVRLRSRLRPQADTGGLLSSILRGIDDAINSVQRIMSELRPSVLDDLGLVPAMEWYLERFRARTGIPCTFEAPPKPLTMEREVTTALFRILQESLQNTARHADASRVRVTLARDGDWLRLDVRDNGKGISPVDLENGRSFGLLEIRERAEIFGGKVEIEGTPGAGTRVTVRILSPNDGGARRDAQATHDR